MRAISGFVLSILLFLVSEIVLVYLGVEKLYFVFFIPVFYSSSLLSLLPLLVFLIPFLLVLKGGESPRKMEYWSDYNSKQEVRTEKNTSYGGLVMIGPVPILFGKGASGRVLVFFAILMAILIIVWFIFAK